jgi:hypothetical protein
MFWPLGAVAIVSTAGPEEDRKKIIKKIMKKP